jgi:hypothetical protein
MAMPWIIVVVQDGGDEPELGPEGGRGHRPNASLSQQSGDGQPAPLGQGGRVIDGLRQSRHRQRRDIPARGGPRRQEHSAARLLVERIGAVGKANLRHRSQGRH